MAVSMNKDHPEGRTPSASNARRDPSLDAAQKLADQVNEQGFRGVETDPTPNENYTVAGVTAGKPTPETDRAHAREVRDHVLGVERTVDGLGRNEN